MHKSMCPIRQPSCLHAQSTAITPTLQDLKIFLKEDPTPVPPLLVAPQLAYFCTGTQRWSRRSRWWCCQGRRCSNSAGNRAGRCPRRSGCSGGHSCCNSAQGSTALGGQRAQGAVSAAGTALLGGPSLGSSSDLPLVSQSWKERAPSWRVVSPPPQGKQSARPTSGW